MSTDNLETILATDTGEGRGYESVLARLYFENGVKTVPYTNEMRVRDKYMSNKIAVLRRHYKGKRFLHICGWQHLQDPHNLYGPENPVKVFIYDKTFCL